MNGTAGFSEPDSTPTRWAAGLEQLRAADTLWLSTVRPDGRPHVTPLIAVWHAGALWFATGPQERKASNLAENPSCVLTTGRSDLVDGALDVVLEGRAEQVTDDAELEPVATAFGVKYGTGPWDFAARGRAFIDRVPVGARRGLGGFLLGRGLWEADPSMRDSEPGAAFADIWCAIPKVVFSRTLDSVQGNARLAEASLAEEAVAALGATDKDVAIGGGSLAAVAIELGLVDELRIFRNPVLVGGGTPFLPPLTEHVRLDLVETSTSTRA